MADFQSRLTDGEGLVQAMERAHAKYAEERWQWLSAEDVATVEKKNWVRNLVSGTLPCLWKNVHPLRRSNSLMMFT